MEEEASKLLQLLHEFYGEAISNERRREIEAQLTSWQQSSEAWKMSIDILPMTTDQFLIMFCMSCLEFVISKKWMTIDWQNKKTIKEFLWRYSLQQNVPSFVLAKTTKLVVDTAKHDWPHFYPDFFTNVMSLMLNEASTPLGLAYLRTISQELGSPRDDVSAARNSELRNLLLSQVGAVLSCSLGLLSSPKVDKLLVLDLLNHLFTWVPSEQIPQPVVNAIFQLALHPRNVDEASAAVSTLIDMMYRHWTPPCWQQFLEFIVTFLQTPTQNLDKGYLEKMCDLLRLVLTSHMSRRADHMAELFAATLSWTSRQETLHPGLTSCMHVWSHVLDHPSADKYSSELVKMAEFVINRIQWTRNGEMVIQHGIDEDFDDDEEEGDEDHWQRALRPCLEVIAKVADLQPDPILSSIVGRWDELCQVSSSMQGSEAHADFLLRDLATFTRAIGRLSPLWGERHEASFIKAVIGHLLTLTKLHYHSSSDSIKIALINVNCEALAALKPGCYWIPRLPESEVQESCREIVDTALKLLNPQTIQRLQHSSVHLLSSLTSAVRLTDFWETTPLIAAGSLPLDHLSKEDGYLLVGAVLNCLVLPDPKSNSTESRLKTATDFLDCLTGALSKAGSSSASQVDTLHLLTYLVRLYQSEGSKQKKFLCAALQKPAESSLALYQKCPTDVKLSQEILKFFKTLLECLQTQVGVAFVQGVVPSFLSSYSSERLEAALASDEGAGLDHLIEILDLVIRTPALSAAGLTPLTVSLSLKMSAMVLKEASPTIQHPYFTLVYGIIEHKWQYLVKGCVDSTVRTEEFLGLLRIMGQALLLSDVHLFKLNLMHFERLNQRWHLYSTTLFKKELLSELLKVLLTTLLNKTHALLSDDIVLCVCHLISADPEAFFNQLLPDFLGYLQVLDVMQRETILRNFQRDMDIPSLTKNIFRLVNDITCYQLCNAGTSS